MDFFEKYLLKYFKCFIDENNHSIITSSYHKFNFKNLKHSYTCIYLASLDCILSLHINLIWILFRLHSQKIHYNHNTNRNT